MTFSSPPHSYLTPCIPVPPVEFGSVQGDGENLVNVQEQLANALLIFEERMAAERENEDEVAEHTVEDDGEDNGEDRDRPPSYKEKEKARENVSLLL